MRTPIATLFLSFACALNGCGATPLQKAARSGELPRFQQALNLRLQQGDIPDEEARQIAVSYAQNEIALRRDWTGYRERLEAARPTDLLSKIETALAGNPKDQFLDAGWATELIESGTDRLLVRHQRGLPELVRESAVEFVESRQMLYSLSR